MLKALADYALSRHLVSSRPGYRYKSLRAYIHLTPEGEFLGLLPAPQLSDPFGKASRRGTLPRYRADGGGTQMQRPSGDRFHPVLPDKEGLASAPVLFGGPRRRAKGRAAAGKLSESPDAGYHPLPHAGRFPAGPLTRTRNFSVFASGRPPWN